MTTNPPTVAEAEVVPILRQLIAIDTTNTGDPDTTVGEALAAEYVVAQLREVGYDPEVIECGAARRHAVALRVAGSDPDRPALLLHGHLDVVPAVAGDWSVPPFEGVEHDGMVWGRGAVDMKDMDAMLIALLRDWTRTGFVPPRDIVVIFTPDEEAGMTYGATWLVANRPDLLRGVTEAVGEVGGFSLTVRDDLRLYLVQAAEKGLAWLRLRATGTAGHGSMINPDNAVTELARAVHRIGDHEFPVTLTTTADTCLRQLSEAFELPYDPRDPSDILAAIGPLARVLGATLRHTANPTQLRAGYKANVIPGVAEAVIDGRFLPGRESEFLATIDELLGPNVTREFVHRDIAVETPFEGALVDAMAAALLVEDPASRTIPYTMSGGTDGKQWSQLGVRCYGFVPRRLPPDLDFAALFHGVDERVPVDAVRFGVRVLQRLIATC